MSKSLQRSHTILCYTFSMSKNTSKKKKSDIPSSGLQEETLFAIYGIGCFVIALFFILAYFGKADKAGEYTFRGLNALLGVGYTLLPLVLIMQGIAFLRSIQRQFSFFQLIGSVIFLVSS